MASVAEQVESVFNKAWGVASSKSATSDALFTTAVGSVSSPHMTPAVLDFDPEVVEPSVDIPQFAEGASSARFFELAQSTIDKLVPLFRSYINEFVPDTAESFNAAQDWILNTLKNGGTGLNKNVEALIYQRDQRRILKENEKAQADLTAMWAAKGYPIPPGAAVGQATRLRLDALDQLAESSRTIAIKQAEMEIENTKLAVNLAVTTYTQILAAASDYIKALSLGFNVSGQILPSITDSQSRLISAASEYYRARISVQELKLKARMPNAEYDQSARAKNADLQMAEIDKRVTAAVAAAQSLGTQAASALNSLHAQVSASAGASTSVGYSYSNQTSNSPGALTSI